jgi:hypothetical protein
MAIKQESPQKVNWWLNELETLGISPKTRNELNDIQETGRLTENIKKVFYQTYKEAYNDDNSQNASNVQNSFNMITIGRHSVRI